MVCSFQKGTSVVVRKFASPQPRKKVKNACSAQKCSKGRKGTRRIKATILRQKPEKRADGPRKENTKKHTRMVPRVPIVKKKTDAFSFCRSAGLGRLNPHPLSPPSGDAPPHPPPSGTPLLSLLPGPPSSPSGTPLHRSGTPLSPPHPPEPPDRKIIKRKVLMSADQHLCPRQAKHVFAAAVEQATGTLGQNHAGKYKPAHDLHRRRGQAERSPVASE